MSLPSIGIVIGAAWNGARAFTATSGPGISPCRNFSGLAYFAEIPAVILRCAARGPFDRHADAHRADRHPLLSRTPQHGDTKHVLLPPNPGRGLGIRGGRLDLADHLQTPVFVMLDLDIGMNHRLSRPLAFDDSRKFSTSIVAAALEAGKEFGRYLQCVGDGIPYRTFPGTHPTKGSFFTRGTSRDRYGAYSEEGAAYADNMQRLLRKFETAKDLVPRPLQANTDESTKYGVICLRLDLARHGRSDRLLEANGHALDRLRMHAFPFHSSVTSFMSKHDFVFVVEQNRDGQLRSLVVNECNIDPVRLVPILHYDGTPITARFITRAIGDHLDTLETGTPLRKVVS